VEPVDGANPGVYRLTEHFPRTEQFGLTAQMRRYAVSIPANIAEGHNRRSRRAYLNHVGIALGSLAELDTLVELSVRLKFGDPTQTGGLEMTLARVGQIDVARTRQIVGSRRIEGVVSALSTNNFSNAERRTPNRLY
jgi:four helix bundle protein